MGLLWTLPHPDDLDNQELQDFIWELSYALAEAKDKLKGRA